ELQLWLLDPANLVRAFSTDETRRLLETPPYWGFCRRSGLALARWVLDHPEQVRGKRVLDFGAGTGAVALAVSAAGAGGCVACDPDHTARVASGLKPDRTALPVESAEDYFAVAGDLDRVHVADVRDDRDNHAYPDPSLGRADQVLVACSRER